MAKDSGVQIREIWPNEELPTPVAVNSFRLSRVDTDVQLLVGFQDLGHLVDALRKGASLSASEAGTPIDVLVKPLHRLVLGRTSLVRLRDLIEEVLRAMERGGSLKDLPIQHQSEKSGPR
jgi:hypothetical protein